MPNWRGYKPIRNSRLGTNQVQGIETGEKAVAKL